MRSVLNQDKVFGWSDNYQQGMAERYQVFVKLHYHFVNSDRSNDDNYNNYLNGKTNGDYR